MADFWCIVIAILVISFNPAYTTSSTNLINIGPLLTHTEHCWTNVIFTENRDFIPHPMYPISISTPRYKYKGLSDCEFEKAASPEPHICTTVLNNYNIKQVTCWSVLLIYIKNPTDVNLIFWYIFQYWSGYNYQSRTVENTEKESLSASSDDTPHFPSIMYMLALESPKGFKSYKPITRKQGKNLYMIYYSMPVLYLYSLESINEVLHFKLLIMPPGVPDSRHFKQASILDISLTVTDGFTKPVIDILIIKSIRETGIVRIECGMPLEEVFETARILKQAFNSTVVINYFANRFGSMQINVYNRDDTKTVSSRHFFLPLRITKYKIITCSGLVDAEHFRDYIQPFQGSVWVGFALTLSVVYVTTWLYFNMTGENQSVWHILVSSCFEQPWKIYNSSKIQFKLRSLLGSFLIICVVLTNSYKGVVVTSLTKVFEKSGIHSLDKAIDMSYTTLYEPFNKDELRAYSYCCNTAKKLSLRWVFRYHRYQNLNYECRNSITHVSLYATILMNRNTNRKKWSSYLEELKLQGGNPRNMTHKYLKKRHDIILFKLYHSLEPKPCNRTIESELLKCNRTMFIEEDGMNSLLFATQYNLEYYKNIYEIPDREGDIPTMQFGVVIRNAQIARQLLRKQLQAALEAGIYTFIKEIELNNKTVKQIQEFRKRFKTLENNPDKPRPLNLTTRLRVIFYVYGICIFISCFAALLDLLSVFVEAYQVRFVTIQLFNNNYKNKQN